MTDKRSVVSLLTLHGAELVIVFVGVYATFWVDNWREQTKFSRSIGGWVP